MAFPLSKSRQDKNREGSLHGHHPDHDEPLISLDDTNGWSSHSAPQPTSNVYRYILFPLLALVLVFGSLYVLLGIDASSSSLWSSPSRSFSASSCDPTIAMQLQRLQQMMETMLILTQRALVQVPAQHEGAAASAVYLPPVDDHGVVLTGQIHLGTAFGLELLKLASQPDVQYVVEVGTWEGGGSTLSLAKGLNTHGTAGTKLITVESNAGRWEKAKKGLSVYPYVECRLGTAVRSNTISSEEEVRGFYDGRGQAHPLNGWEGYRRGEQEESALHDDKTPFLEHVCREGKQVIDLLLLDGGEFYGPAEYKHVRELCRPLPRYLALHDTNSFKNFDVRALLLAKDSGYTVLVDGDKDGRGFTIFKRTD